ncbi:uncharacterized protein NECHADRAFT_83581 [Fusarium vanettenii 77-13-4]|uniref:Heterokaryon incompatibility domain-containing protein n=1 Tax=Fusarium vanettenii (strain ATCC MYA-4622 / CBS 123669 / FGSC 9596 / NRRL 45880 / 77-13-4) TaxID=660122 RepID=C7YY63_FUSV7|nr:uncharacterized protein NECHADRAFT_83581 [Fusarium vanettenii 77-13-4]EEU43137.1 hypothetical protein NECHADRAFT_83581 [Fusarium vanettenii 77-13-4]
MDAVIQECVAEHKELLQVHDHCPERAYVEVQVPADAKKVVAVTFTAVSHDQGWASKQEEPSFTWFDASVKRPEGRGDLRTITVFHNRLANKEFFELNTRWHLRDGPRRRLWIEALRPGDVIQLIPRAIYTAWVNIVKECRIKIEYETKTIHEELDELHLFSNIEHYNTFLSVNDQEIRLLHVEPGEFDDPIKAYFSQASLNDAENRSLSFDALSYCWGDVTDRTDIFLAPDKDDVKLDGALQRFSVGRSAAEALRRLRKKQEILTIWIDAVCINQDDLEERAQQVTLMSSIYSLASTVHIWLGENNVGVETCLGLIRDICNYNSRQCPGGDGCSCSGTPHGLSLEEMDAHMDAQKKEKIPISFQSMWEVFDIHEKSWSREIIDLAGWYGNTQLSFLMSTLFENPWFTRVWVVQEALSAKKALVHCSGEQVLWEELLQVNSWLGDPRFRGQSPHIMSQAIMQPIWKSLKPKGRTTETPITPVDAEDTGKLSGIFDVFFAGLDLKATDPRDKLFALLTFADETHVAEDLDDLIRPNYDKPAERVFADFTRWWIREHDSLAILSAVHCHPARTWRRTVGSDYPEMEPNRPTWSVSTIGNSRWVQANLNARFKFSAGGKTKPNNDLLKTSNPLIIRLSGHYVSEIAAISHYPIEYLYPFAHDNGEQSDICAVFDKLFDPCGFTGLWTLKPNDETVEKARHKYEDHVIAHWNYVRRPNLQVLTPAGAPELERHETDFVPTCLDPCFFVAENGQYGLCPWPSKVGDVIVVLHGGNVPYLLRPVKNEDGSSGGGFEFIGECFVDGIMHGEFLQSLGGMAEAHEVFDII